MYNFDQKHHMKHILLCYGKSMLTYSKNMIAKYDETTEIFIKILKHYSFPFSLKIFTI